MTGIGLAEVPRSLVRLLWSVLLLLALVGFAGAVARTFGIFDSVIFADGPVPEMTRLDRGSTHLFSKLTRIERGSPEWTGIEEQNRRFFGKFTTHPLITLVHVVPAALFMLLAPSQLSSRLRQHHAGWHRWSGRVLVLLAFPVALSGLWFGLAVPFAGAVEASAILIFGTWFLYAVARGFLAIRRRDVARHREWMLRMLAVALGAAAVRITGLPFALLTREGPATWFGSSVWIGFASTVMAAELWIRWTRRAARKPEALLPLREPGVLATGPVPPIDAAVGQP